MFEVLKNFLCVEKLMKTGIKAKKNLFDTFIYALLLLIKIKRTSTSVDDLNCLTETSLLVTNKTTRWPTSGNDSFLATLPYLLHAHVANL